MGSPPRMRGKPVTKQLWPRRVGITPADAGKTTAHSVPGFTPRDHPRGCGENILLTSAFTSGLGSPPRMRGKRNRGRYYPPLRRITPADAGKTRTLRLSRPKSGDHPRGCGENNTRDGECIPKKGSPPRMRGKPASPPCRNSAARITPADAGKTRDICARSRSAEDHPRGCGENVLESASAGWYAGSPPRMRGKPHPRTAQCHSPRITPADAGKTYETAVASDER